MCDYCCILRANMRVNSHVFSKVEQDLAKVLWVSHLWHLLHGDGVHVEGVMLLSDVLVNFLLDSEFSSISISLKYNLQSILAVGIQCAHLVLISKW